MPSVTFHKFPQFPLEIRRLIWQACLPVDNGAVVPFCKEWCSQFVNPGPDNQGTDVRFLVKVGSASLPTLTTCREARDETRVWLEQNDLMFYWSEELEHQIIVRKWDRTRDILCLDADSLDEIDNLAQDVEEEALAEMCSEIEHVTLSATTAYNSYGHRALIARHMPNLQTLRVSYSEEPEEVPFLQANRHDAPPDDETHHVAAHGRLETREIAGGRRMFRMVLEDIYGGILNIMEHDIETWESKLHEQFIELMDEEDVVGFKVPRRFFDLEKGTMKLMVPVEVVQVG